MEIKTFRARTIQEAIQEVRRQLGPDAAILQTKELPASMLSWWRGSQVEVTATKNMEVASRMANRASSSDFDAVSNDWRSEASYPDKASESTAGLRSNTISSYHPAKNESHVHNQVRQKYYNQELLDQPAVKPNLESRRLDKVTAKVAAQIEEPVATASMSHSAFRDPSSFRGSSPATEANRANIAVELSNRRNADDAIHSKRSGHPSDVQSQLSQLTSVVDQLVRQQSGVDQRPRKLAGALFEVFTELLDSDIQPEFARQLIDQAEQQCSQEQLSDPVIIKARMANWVQQQIQTSGPIQVASGQQTIVALVGPTGVGKTTTLAKLAAGFHLTGQVRVGLITIDTFRMGAIDQIRQYAEIMALDVEVVHSPDQMPVAIEQLSDCQLVLLDTTGRSPRDSAQLEYLADMLRAAQPKEIHLVASASSSPANLRSTIEYFSVVCPNRLVLTKLDEVVSMGGLLPVLQSSPLPISYITTGQNVPHDIQEASRRRLASILLGQTIIS